MNTVNIECPSCRATGLYRGCAEPEGTAVVCRTCGGSGCKEFSYTPFAGRKPMADVRVVAKSRGTFILGCGPTGKPVTYAEFQAGRLP